MKYESFITYAYVCIYQPTYARYTYSWKTCLLQKFLNLFAVFKLDILLSGSCKVSLYILSFCLITSVTFLFSKYFITHTLLNLLLTSTNSLKQCIEFIQNGATIHLTATTRAFGVCVCVYYIKRFICWIFINVELYLRYPLIYSRNR